MTVETSLKYRLYELTPGLWSLFSNEDQKMNKANNLCSTSLKWWTDTLVLNFTNQLTLVDGGWPLYKVKWKEGQKFLTAISATYVQHLKALLLLMAIAAHQKITITCDIQKITIIYKI